MTAEPSKFEPPELLNIADYFLDRRIAEGRGERTAVHTSSGAISYAQIQEMANRFAHVLSDAGVEPEQRVLLALPDSPEFVAAFFGTLKVGGVVVMVNPALPAETIGHFLSYTRARVAITHHEVAGTFRQAAEGSRFPKELLVLGETATDSRVASAPDRFDNFPTHRDDPAVWLFSGGTTGKPKAVIQTHRAFANTTECYAKRVIGYREDDITLSVPKLYFGYATGSNLLFPFAVGASTVLFREPPTADVLFELIATFRPTVMINVPTMINKMVSHPDAATQDLSCVRICTSAGEALPIELYERWTRAFGGDLLDGLGTAEMWHIFISNAPRKARPGTLGTVVPGFEIKACDEHGHSLAAGEVGWLWVRGDSRAIGYWQHMEKTQAGFRGDWYVSGDMIAIDEDGFVTYHGRGDEMLKVSGKWLAPQDVEGCLLEHPAVAEACVVGIVDAAGLMKPHAYVVAKETRDDLAEELKAFTRDKLEPYKHPREVHFVAALPRTHLGKVDRGKLRRG